jgi:hypothetical protein
MKRVLPLLLLAAACGARTPTATGSGSGGPVAEALTWTGCGPTDGPAVVVLIAEGPVACVDRLTLQASDHLDVEIWSGAVPSPGQTLVLQGNAGAAASCHGGTCVPLVGATIRFDASDGTGWTATLSYAEGGVNKQKTFHTTACVVQQMCG